MPGTYNSNAQVMTLADALGQDVVSGRGNAIVPPEQGLLPYLRRSPSTAVSIVRGPRTAGPPETGFRDVHAEKGSHRA